MFDMTPKFSISIYVDAQIADETTGGGPLRQNLGITNYNNEYIELAYGGDEQGPACIIKLNYEQAQELKDFLNDKCDFDELPPHLIQELDDREAYRNGETRILGKK